MASFHSPGKGGMRQDGGVPASPPERFPVRIRSISSLSIAAAAVLLLAGCAGGQSDATSQSGGDLCATAAASGAASDSVDVGGEVGKNATATFSSPLEVPDLERTVVSEGEGPALSRGDYVAYGITAFDAATGEQVGSAGYADAPLQPQQITSDGPLAQLFGCAKVGSRIVAALPAGQEGGAQVYVIDVLEATPDAQWCTVGDFSGNAPQVAFGEGGRPTITIPQGEAPANVAVEELEAGDGDVVEPGDTVEVNYEGVKWSDGAVFDSSWEKGKTASFATDEVVTGFKRALEGQKVGSTVLVSMSPECGYGVAGASQNPLAGETLVFVVDIIGTQQAG